MWLFNSCFPYKVKCDLVPISFLQLVDGWTEYLAELKLYKYISFCIIPAMNPDLSPRSDWCESVASHELRQLWGRRESQVTRDDIQLCSVAQNRLLRQAILLPSLSSLVASQGTILPRQSWKHGSDGYPSMRYLGWNCTCFAGVADGACFVRLVSRVVIRLTGCAEPGSRKLGKVAKKWFHCWDLIDQIKGNVVAPKKEGDKRLDGF